MMTNLAVPKTVAAQTPILRSLENATRLSTAENAGSAATPDGCHGQKSEYEPGDDLVEVKRQLLAAIAEEITDHQLARNWTHLIGNLGLTEISNLAKILDETGDRQAIEGALISLQVAQIRARLNPGRKTVALYFPTAAYREQLGTIPDQLRERGYNVVTIVGVICDDKCERQANVFYGGHCGQTEIVNHLDFVDLFITPILAAGLPRRALKAYILHDIHDSPLGDEAITRKISELLREFDFVFTPSQPSVELFRTVVPLARQPGDKPITLIKAGYPKLDRLTRYFEEHRQDTPTLIYAPTVFGYGFDEIVSVVSHGDAIIDAILRGIPDHKLIFRPHPHTLHTPVVQALAAKYRDHPNFIFDDNASSYMENYSQSALMISDISGTAFTYAFATLRPVVFFSPNEKILQERYAGLCYAADRSLIGCVVTDVLDLVAKIHLLLRHRGNYQAAVRTCRDRTIFNVGRAEASFLEHLECVLDGRRRSDWTELGSEEA